MYFLSLSSSCAIFLRFLEYFNVFSILFHITSPCMCVFRSFRRTLLATLKAPSPTAAMLLWATRCWMQQSKGAWPQLTERVWPYRRGRRSESLTSAPPLFCCLKLPKTSASTCSRDSESEWERDSAASDWLSYRLRGRGLMMWNLLGLIKDRFSQLKGLWETKKLWMNLGWLGLKLPECLVPHDGKCQTSFFLLFFILSL